MGTGMSRNLIAAGYHVIGYDIQDGARNRAQGFGVDVRDSATDVAQSTQTILLSLMTSDDRRALLWGKQAMADALRPGTLILDTTTARAADLREDHKRLQPHNVRLVDVCISGSSKVVEDRQALALVGDTEDKGAQYDSLLRTFTKARYYLGDLGRGNEAKLIVNTVFGLHRLVLAEALGLASRAGFDLEQILEVLRAGETYSVAMDTKGPKMISGDYEPAVARLEQHAKDVKLILEYATETGANTPLSGLHNELLQHALEQGLGSLDNAAIFKLFRR
jgi:3-hydroxyisobutyrate dehydrogenase-like beta-hydroxyacid dehydrogenase